MNTKKLTVHNSTIQIDFVFVIKQIFNYKAFEICLLLLPRTRSKSKLLDIKYG